MSDETSDIDIALARATAQIGAGHNAFVYVPERPLIMDDALDRPLGALTLAVKDVIDCENMPTRAGSSFTTVQPRSATLVDQLVSQGAAVIGKTQAHQFSFGTTGDVSFAGPVRNALDPTLMAGGSSGGSAVAVALGIADAALGTDTAGSVRIPAALNGVVGFKPTYDAVSSDGIFPLSPSLDTPGFLARDVQTIRRLWSVLEVETEDAKAMTQAPPRIGVLSSASLEGMASSVNAVFAQVLEALTTPTLHIREAPGVDLQALRNHYSMIVGWEASMVHGGWARLAPEFYDDEIQVRIHALAGVKHHEYLESVLDVQERRKSLLKMFDDFDVLVSPTLAIETPELGQREVHDDSGLGQVWGALAHFTSPWNVVGFPAISLPIPNTQPRTPAGLQLIGKPGHDSKLLEVAYSVQSHLAKLQLTR